MKQDLTDNDRAVFAKMLEGAVTHAALDEHFESGSVRVSLRRLLAAGRIRQVGEPRHEKLDDGRVLDLTQYEVTEAGQ